ncbi:MAG: symmetrical bis(5'-nucleosyl)-tetraphosphatase [Wenzhouxiangellaceae bacterium]|nr:symmetrical bis(5'-nucleosyl)-tetraphosphatase [Wenzhouxiangellaceae bacterium]
MSQRRRRIFIGDVQGCWKAFRKLLEKVEFDPASDQLCMAGDLVNRGGKSLKMLRYFLDLGEPHFTVLGNHDLHLLAYVAGPPEGRKVNPEFEKVLQHRDCERIVEWLRRQPVLWTDEGARMALVHAGIDPRWDVERAQACAAELERTLRGPDFTNFLASMYGDKPRRWKPGQDHMVRMRTTTNVLTRMRFVKPNGKLDFQSSGHRSDAPKDHQPWFELLHPDWDGWTVVFGHWSVLGLVRENNVVGLDSGCVWGGALSALVVEGKDRRIVQVDCAKHRSKSQNR